MMTRIDKRDRADLFRNRLMLAMQERAVSQSALARAIRADRSTISQLLSGDGARLPNAHLVGECASELGVSADWLLGLSERPESAADLMAINLSMTEAPRALIDQQIFDWHKEAKGYKIRHVPAALPDMLKTHAMLEWEYRPHLGRTTEQAIGASEDRLAFMRTNRSDYEIALPLHEFESFARAEGYYAILPQAVRLAQIDQIAALYDQFFPSLRLHLYDAHRVFSSPITVFGPLLAVLYIGRNYLAFRDSERVQTFSRHFDGLIREAAVSDRDIPAYLEELRRTASASAGKS
ncbi:MAG: helix-turn-helix domain-containing protein [Rhodobacter sp.]|nr:helix-turn-helix domain-containing protein [Rhodobacter sp.]